MATQNLLAYDLGAESGRGILGLFDGARLTLGKRVGLGHKVALTDTQQKYARSKELAAKSLVPQSDLDSAKIAVDSADAQLKSSQATVEQAKATVNQNRVNLEHTIIGAPIDGP